MGFIVYLIVAFIFAFVISNWAESKGLPARPAFWVSLLLSPLLGILYVVASKPNQEAVETRMITTGGHQKCPACAEVIKAEARKCRFCGTEIVRPVAAEMPKEVIGLVPAKVAAKVEGTPYKADDEEQKAGRLCRNCARLGNRSNFCGVHRQTVLWTDTCAAFEPKV